MARRLYDGDVPLSSPTRRFSATGLLVAAAGTALFVWLVRSVGPREIWNGFRQIGGGLGWILILGGVRFAARAAAWMLCIEPPHVLRFADAFTAVVCGDALGNVTPLGPLVSEPTKIACVRRHVPVGVALTALAIENVIYSLSVGAMIAAGAITLIFSVELPIQLREFSEVAVVAVVALFGIAAWIVWRRPDVVGKLVRVKGLRGSRIEKLRDVEQEVLTFASRRRAVIAPLVALELGFHALGVAEKHLTLWLILGAPPSLLTSFIVESVDRLITVAFKFVPFQVGIGEAGTGFVTMLLGLGRTPGVTLSIVRKARMAIWSVIGTALLVRQGLSARRVLEDAELRGADH
jgi:hypothetical protein